MITFHILLLHYYTGNTTYPSLIHTFPPPGMDTGMDNRWLVHAHTQYTHTTGWYAATVTLTCAASWLGTGLTRHWVFHAWLGVC